MDEKEKKDAAMMEGWPTAKPDPRIVCLVGSTRFMEAFQRANYMEGLAGRIVLSICCMTNADAAQMEAWGRTPETKKKLDELHRAKIRLCDEVFVLNVGDYIGETTAEEIEYAFSLGKRIRWLEGAKDPAEQVPTATP